MELQVANGGSVAVNENVFAREFNEGLVHQAVVAYMAAGRAGTKAQKNRSDVSGGGAKPFRQKGTGRARAGSTVSPIWVGGAVTFGPHPRDYSFKVNRKVWRLALRMALSSRLASGNLLVVKDITLPEVKTKHFAKVKADLGLGKTLIVAPKEAEGVFLAARNLPGVTVLTPEQLNVYDILNHGYLVLLESVVAPVTERLSA